MGIEILLFGRLTEIIGESSLHLEDVADTDQVRQYLHDKYTGLQQMNYQLAVDQVIIHHNTLLTDGMKVALMPPFSGG